MIKISVALIALIAGVAATELCGDPVDRVCRNDNGPKLLPETAEELQEFCTVTIDFFECGVKHAKRCDKSGILHETSTYLKIFQDICDQGTLLYEAVLGNLQCFREFITGRSGEECHRKHNLPSKVALQKYTEILVEEGLLAENNTFYTMACMDTQNKSVTELSLSNNCWSVRIKIRHMLQELACYAVKLEDKCGKIALNTCVEIAQKFAPVAECGETFHYLPTIIRVYKLVEEEANETEEVFKKRK